MRDYNERLVLSLIHQHGALAKTDIARMTGLSAQTASVIMRKLEADGLIEKGDPQRGKVGKPLTPIRLRPDGILSIGLKIGRRSCELVLMDVTGNIRHQMGMTYVYPLPHNVLGFLRDGLQEITFLLTPAQRARVAGIGVAMPFQMWNWLDSVQATPVEMDSWRHLDFPAAVAAFCDHPVQISNDATAACAAEHLFGVGRDYSDYAYFFQGYFVGGGVVLNDAVYSGRSGNAGAFGTLPVRDTATPRHQLIHNASLFLLERDLAQAGLDPLAIWREPEDWTRFRPHLDTWIDRSARHLAVAAVSACAVIDFQAVLIDGGYPPHVRAQVAMETNRHIAAIDTQGIAMPQVVAASIGARARVIGAASLPIFAQYLLTRPGFAA